MSVYLRQLYTGCKDFKHRNIKSYFYLIILHKYVSCRITYKWLKIILCFCHVHKVLLYLLNHSSSYKQCLSRLWNIAKIAKMVTDIHFGWFQNIPSFTRSLPAKRLTRTKINFAVTTTLFSVKIAFLVKGLLIHLLISSKTYQKLGSIGSKNIFLEINEIQQKTIKNVCQLHLNKYLLTLSSKSVIVNLAWGQFCSLLFMW